MPTLRSLPPAGIFILRGGGRSKGRSVLCACLTVQTTSESIFSWLVPEGRFLKIQVEDGLINIMESQFVYLFFFKVTGDVK